MTTKTYINDNGTWRTAKKIHHNDNNVWRDVKKAWYNDSGTWRLVFSGAFTSDVHISSATANYVFNTHMTSLGWNGADPVQVNLYVDSGAVIYSTSTGVSAFTINALPAGSIVTVYNYGVITGKGGIGGNGTTRSYGGTAGSAGGTGLYVRNAITMYNYNTISGGGGGGGGGGWYNYPAGDCNGSGGGGGGGSANSPTAGGAGMGGIGGNLSGSYGYDAGGAGGWYSGGHSGCAADTGGAGGNRGVAGAAGNCCCSAGCSRSHGASTAGGASGYAINGYGYISWGAYNSVLGPVA